MPAEIVTLDSLGWSIEGLAYEVKSPRLPTRTPIVEDSVHSALIAVFTDQEQRRQRAPVTSLLDGIATCGSCGAVVQEGRRVADDVSFYRCLGPKACRRVSVVAVHVDRHVTEAFLDLIIGSGNVEAIVAGVTGPNRSDGITVELAALDAQERALGVRLVAGNISDLVFEGAQGYIDAQRADLEAELRATKTGQPILTGQQLTTLASMWDRLDCADRNAALRLVIDRVVVSKATRRTGSVFDPDRVTIHYFKGTR